MFSYIYLYIYMNIKIEILNDWYKEDFYQKMFKSLK